MNWGGTSINGRTDLCDRNRELMALRYREEVLSPI